MNTTVINLRTQANIKKAAQRVADDLGLSLSALINGFLKQLVKTKSITLHISEKPSDYLLQVIKEANEDIKEKRVSPGYKTAKEAISWLHDKGKKYEYKIHKKVC